jgi:uncharacterized protein YbaP (TraB family)
MIQKIKLFSIVFLSLFLLSFSACKSAKEVHQDDTIQTDQIIKLDKALLWKISGKELESPSYLYGTIHIINKEDFFLPEGTLTAMEKTNSMYFEIDMNDMTDLTAQMGLLKEIFMKDDQTLKGLLSEEDYTMVSNHFKELGLPIFMLERMKPMFLTIFASGDFDIGGLQGGSMKSYEMEFFEMAQQTNKKVGGLETMEFQMSMFDSIPYKAQADMLVETIKSSDAGSDSFQAMIDMYKAQDINAMVTMISEDETGMGDYDEMLVDMRNKNWIPIMEEKMKLGPVFFAVGAGHLAGKNGVIPLLMKAGYTVTPVKAASDI